MFGIVRHDGANVEQPTQLPVVLGEALAGRAYLPVHGAAACLAASTGETGSFRRLTSMRRVSRITETVRVLGAVGVAAVAFCGRKVTGRGISNR